MIAPRISRAAGKPTSPWRSLRQRLGNRRVMPGVAAIMIDLVAGRLDRVRAHRPRWPRGSAASMHQRMRGAHRRDAPERGCLLVADQEAERSGDRLHPFMPASPPWSGGAASRCRDPASLRHALAEQLQRRQETASATRAGSAHRRQIARRLAPPKPMTTAPLSCSSPDEGFASAASSSALCSITTTVRASTRLIGPCRYSSGWNACVIAWLISISFSAPSSADAVQSARRRDRRNATRPSNAVGSPASAALSSRLGRVDHRFGDRRSRASCSPSSSIRLAEVVITMPSRGSVPATTTRSQCAASADCPPRTVMPMTGMRLPPGLPSAAATVSVVSPLRDSATTWAVCHAGQ